MSFQSLPLEIREKIYRGLLCPSGGLHLQTRLDINFQRGERKRAQLTAAKLTLSEEEEEQDEDEEDLEEPDFDVDLNEIIATVPISTSILSTNRQISREATRILFKYNRFTCDLAAKQALRFLRRRNPHMIKAIKDIGFGRRSFSADDSDCTEYWKPLSKFIGQQMRVGKVTVAVPSSHDHEVVKKDERIRGPNEEWYWWPAVYALLKLLLKGKIRELRLGYAETYGKLKEDNSVEDGEDDFSAVRELRKKCQGRGFGVRREDDLISDVGTVLVLTVLDNGRQSK